MNIKDLAHQVLVESNPLVPHRAATSVKVGTVCVDVRSNTSKLETPLKIICKDRSSAKPQVVLARASQRRRRCSSGGARNSPLPSLTLYLQVPRPLAR